MTDTDTQAKPKAPPAWMKRDPMSRAGVAATLTGMAEACQQAGEQTADRDVKAGLQHRCSMIARAAKAIEFGQPDAGALAALRDYADARLGAAKATTEERARARYMDEAHAFTEALRYLKGSN